MKNRKLISILIVFIFISLCDGNNLTFYEENLTPLQIIVYSDNSVVFRLVERLNQTCNVPNLTYRILYPNGTHNLITVYDHQIPSFNFCSNSDDEQNSMQVDDKLFFENTITNYILAIYDKEENGALKTFGMMIDWNGKITSNTLLGTHSNVTIGYMDEDNQYNYQFFQEIKDSYDLNLKQFIATPDEGKLEIRREVLIQMPKDYKGLRARRTIDSKVFFTLIYESEDDASILEPKWRIYGAILQKNSDRLDQFLIYQAPKLNLKLLGATCNQFYNGDGFLCSIAFIDSDISTISTIKVTILSNGRIINTEKDIDFKFSFSDRGGIFAPLESGGIIMAIVGNYNEGCMVSVSLLGSTSKFSTTLRTNMLCHGDFMNNNTIVVIQDIKTNYWTLVTTDIPYELNDKGYNNPMINWTIPAINETIPVETNQIKVAYNIPIECSSQNISIYQKVDDTKDILRETYSGESKNCKVLSDNTTLSLTVLSSTFNQPNSIYYIKINADFVKQNKTLEPILGIPKYKWTFFTDTHRYEINDSVNAFVRLTLNATSYFENLSSKEKSIFSQNLINQLADIVPIPHNRIATNGDYQKDSSSLNQILIPIRIKDSNDDSVINVSAIFESLNTLIENKVITSISGNELLTSMLDESYGLKKNKTLLDIITIPVIVMGVILSILVICYVWAYRRFREGQNLTIIIITVMLYDFIMDLLFIFDLNAKKLKTLYIISLIFTILPIFLNLSAAFYIISKENSENPKFYKYFLKNPKVVSICSVISGADIEILNILSSKFAGFEMFAAPFSQQAEKYIFWYAFIGFCFEDIPQFAIQIAYRSTRVEYTIIPALALISSSLMLLSNITGRLYLVMIKCRSIQTSIDDIISHYY